MTTPNNLAARLGNLQIDRTEDDASASCGVHILTLEFPAPELLPDDYLPFLTQPSSMEARPRPNKDALQIESLGTKFFAAFNIESNTTLPTIDLQEDNFRALLTATGRLGFRAGTSSLRMVSFNPAEGGSGYQNLVYRFRLDTVYEDGSRASQLFDLDEVDWQDLVAQSDEEEWIALLHGLVTRGSERAFFEVQGILLDEYGAEAVQAEEAQWTRVWLWPLPKTAEDLFMARLEPVLPADAETLCADKDGMLKLRLACGHITSIRKINIAAMTAESVQTQSCPQCDKRIMQPADYEELAVKKGWDSLVAYRATARHWNSLDLYSPSPFEHHTFDPAEVFQAVKVSLEGLDMPDSVCPTSLCPARYHATQLIVNEIQSQYNGEHDHFQTTPFDLRESLLGIAEGVSVVGGQTDAVTKACMLPGYLDFLTLWLTRAVNVLTHKTCKRKGSRHSGLHQHSNNQWHNSMHAYDDCSVSSDEEEESNISNVEAAMSKVENEMRETHIS